ncbi:hypothetical protein [Moorena sp. SIO4G3]|nr:hypothetical protein [Moorena sp. SIO4G3]
MFIQLARSHSLQIAGISDNNGFSPNVYPASAIAFSPNCSNQQQ